MPPFLRATVKHRSAGRIMPQSQALCMVQTIHLGPVPRWKFSVAKFFGIQVRHSCCRSFQSVLQQLLQEFFSGCKVTHPTFFTQKPGKRLKPNIHYGEVCRCLYFKHFKTTFRPPILETTSAPVWHGLRNAVIHFVHECIHGGSCQCWSGIWSCNGRRPKLKYQQAKHRSFQQSSPRKRRSSTPWKVCLARCSLDCPTASIRQNARRHTCTPLRCQLVLRLHPPRRPEAEEAWPSSELSSSSDDSSIASVPLLCMDQSSPSCAGLLKLQNSKHI